MYSWPHALLAVQGLHVFLAAQGLQAFLAAHGLQPFLAAQGLGRQAFAARRMSCPGRQACTALPDPAAKTPTAMTTASAVVDSIRPLISCMTRHPSVHLVVFDEKYFRHASPIPPGNKAIEKLNEGKTL